METIGINDVVTVINSSLQSFMQMGVVSNIYSETAVVLFPPPHGRKVVRISALQKVTGGKPIDGDMTPAEIAEYEAKLSDDDLAFMGLNPQGAASTADDDISPVALELSRLKAENARLSAALESLKKQESDQFNRYVKQVNSTIIGYSDEFGYIMNNETIDYIILQTPLDGESRWVARHPAIQEAIDGGWVEVIYTAPYVNDQGKGYTVRLTESGKQRRHDWFEATQGATTKKQDSEAQ